MLFNQNYVEAQILLVQVIDLKKETLTEKLKKNGRIYMGDLDIPEFRAAVEKFFNNYADLGNKYQTHRNDALNELRKTFDNKSKTYIEKKEFEKFIKKISRYTDEFNLMYLGKNPKKKPNIFESGISYINGVGKFVEQKISLNNARTFSPKRKTAKKINHTLNFTDLDSPIALDEQKNLQKPFTPNTNTVITEPKETQTKKISKLETLKKTITEYSQIVVDKFSKAFSRKKNSDNQSNRQQNTASSRRSSTASINSDGLTDLDVDAANNIINQNAGLVKGAKNFNNAFAERISPITDREGGAISKIRNGAQQFKQTIENAKLDGIIRNTAFKEVKNIIDNDDNIKLFKQTTTAKISYDELINITFKTVCEKLPDNEKNTLRTLINNPKNPNYKNDPTDKYFNQVLKATITKYIKQELNLENTQSLRRY
jgi:hypothetical protein